MSGIHAFNNINDIHDLSNDIHKGIPYEGDGPLTPPPGGQFK